MSKTLPTLVCLLVAAWPVAAQISGPTDVTVPVGRLAVVPLTVEVDEADYTVLGGDCDALREYDPSPKKLRLRVIGYSPGVAFVVVGAQKGGKLLPLTVVKVTFQGAGPTPPVPPGPGPAPPGPGPTPVPPTPAKQAAWVVMVTDQDADSVANAAVIASDRFRKTLDGWGLKFRVYDKGSAQGQELAKAVPGLPGLVVLDKDGFVIAAVKCPDKDVDAAAAVAKAVGK